MISSGCIEHTPRNYHMSRLISLEWDENSLYKKWCISYPRRQRIQYSISHILPHVLSEVHRYRKILTDIYHMRLYIVVLESRMMGCLRGEGNDHVNTLVYYSRIWMKSVEYFYIGTRVIHSHTLFPAFSCIWCWFLTIIRGNGWDTYFSYSPRVSMEKNSVFSGTPPLHLGNSLSYARKPPYHDLSFWHPAVLNDHHKYPHSMCALMDPLPQYPLCTDNINLFNGWILLRVSYLYSYQIYTHTRRPFSVWTPARDSWGMEEHSDTYPPRILYDSHGRKKF